MEKQKVVVIGAGFGGLGAAILMAKKGYDVTVLEKNDKVGGRANLLEKDGFKRDMGPSWYLMPDAFERYFETIGRKVSDYLDLKKLEPSYRVFFKNPNGKDLLDPSTPLRSTPGVLALQRAQDDGSMFIDLYADVEKAAETFESIEKGSGDQLKKYLKSSAYQYDIAMNKFVFKNYDSIFDFMTPQLAIEGLQLNVFSSLYSYVSRFVKTENLKKILMYPSVFLGTSPYQTPALFNIMSHVDFNQGVFYPQGGIYEVPKALYEIALEEGVKFEFGTEVEKIVVDGGEVKGVEVKCSNVLNTKIIEAQPTIQQKVELFQKVFALHPWNDHMTIQEATELVQKIEKLEGFFENHIVENGTYIGGSFSIKLINGVPFEFENLTKQEDFTQYAKSVYPDYDPALTWNGRNTFIEPVYQNQGYGRYLLHLSEQKAIKMGAKFRVISTLVNSYQQEYFEKEGYIVFWSIKNFGHELVYMIKKLQQFIPTNIVISNADMRHTETKLLDSDYQTYPQSYWEKQVISPSGFIMYLGVDGELPQLKHHTLVFNDDWKTGFDQIFKTPVWPDDPSFYICNPSKTDPSVAPVGKENLFVLVPIAPGLASTSESLQQYADKILDDMAISCDIPDLKKRVEVCELFSVPQFEQYYNAYKGTALGLAHTMFQSAVWRPNNYSKKAKGLYYSGGYTTPGIGMPMCLISAMLVAERIEKSLKKR